VPGPIERAKHATALIEDWRAASTEAARIRREAIDELRASGMTQAEVAQALGLTRARVSQLVKMGPPPERAFLGAGRLTIAVALKQEAEHGRPAVAQETVAAAERLRDLAHGLDLDSTIDYVPPPGILDLNRDDLIVLIGPRLSPLVAQILAADPVLEFRSDDAGWYIVDQREGKTYRSHLEEGAPGCVGYLGRFNRPDGRGTFLYMAGIHALGVHVAAHYVEHNLASLYDQVRTRRFSALVEGDFEAASREVTASRLITPLYRHDQG